MKTKFFCFIAGMAVLFAACKKNVSDEQFPASSDAATFKAKSWFEKERSKPVTALQAKQLALRFSDGIPEWDKINQLPETMEMVVPINENIKGNTSNGEKYLVLKENAAGDIQKGYYLFVVGNNRPAMSSSVLVSNEMPANFKGALLKYSMDGVKISSRHYTSGEVTGSEDRIVTKRKINTESQNIVPVDDGCHTVTIDWYWQVYVDGVLVDEVYLFSSTQIQCEGGGGGPSQGSTCAEQAINFLEQGHVVSELQSMETEIAPDSLSCVTRPNWKIYSAGTWFIYSYETIVWKRLSRHESYGFSSYTSRGDAALGTSIGGTRSYTIISKTAIPVGPGGTSVIIEIDFTVKNQVICNAVPLDPVYLGGRGKTRFFPPVNVIFGD